MRAARFALATVWVVETSIMPPENHSDPGCGWRPDEDKEIRPIIHDRLRLVDKSRRSGRWRSGAESSYGQFGNAQINVRRLSVGQEPRGGESRPGQNPAQHALARDAGPAHDDLKAAGEALRIDGN